MLKRYSGEPFRKSREPQRIETEEYYRFITHQIEETEFRSDVDKVILMKFSEGAAIKSICDELSAIGQRRCRNTVTFTIRKYEMRWGIKQYTAKQLNKKVG